MNGHGEWNKLQLLLEDNVEYLITSIKEPDAQILIVNIFIWILDG